MFVASARLKTVWIHYLYLKRSAEEAGRALPSTIPMSPALGKKLMIVRQEVSPPQPGLFVGFDTFARASTHDALPANYSPETQLLVKGDSKKRWSLLGKVLSMTTGSSVGQPSPLEGQAKRGPAVESGPIVGRRGAMEFATTRPVAPLLSQGAKPTFKSPSTEPDALASPPVFDEPKYIFRFILGWVQQPAPTVGRDVVRPKLPAPAQSQVAARARDGLATSTTSIPMVRHAEDARRSQTGRRSSANASVEEWLRDTSMATIGLGNESWSTGNSGVAERHVNAGVGPAAGAQEHHESGRETPVEAVKPGKNSTYSGRSLAEWAHVVAEYNSFVERRREEGVERPSEVEVPGLGVEGFRKLGG